MCIWWRTRRSNGQRSSLVVRWNAPSTFSCIRRGGDGGLNYPLFDQWSEGVYWDSCLHIQAVNNQHERCLVRIVLLEAGHRRVLVAMSRRHQTSALAFDISEAELKIAIENLPNVGTVDVSTFRNGDFEHSRLLRLSDFHSRCGSIARLTTESRLSTSNGVLMSQSRNLARNQLGHWILLGTLLI
jgi:hypothetical protein